MIQTLSTAKRDIHCRALHQNFDVSCYFFVICGSKGERGEGGLVETKLEACNRRHQQG